MQILHIIPGSGGSFYCGNCLRDSNCVQELRKMDHDVIKIPMYLPLFRDEHDLEDIPVFYGAISLYLKERWPVFEKLPWLDKVFNSKLALKFAAGMAGTTRAKGLEEMTVSMLQGERGKQATELEKMIEWIRQHYQPDIVHLSNALLLGLASRLKAELNVPVLCSLQDEHVWVEGMHPRFQKNVWRLMRERASDIDCFIAVSDYYSGLMEEKLELSPEILRHLYLGVDPGEYVFLPASEKPRNIGFISQMSYGNGLDILVDAFITLCRTGQLEDTRLILTGGHTHDDTRFLHKQRKKLQKAGVYDRVEFHESFTGPGRTEFFNKVAVVSVPVRGGEAFGLYLLEAQASGCPVVQPAVGAFPEIIARSGGGVTYAPNHPGELAKILQDLLADPGQLDRLSYDGREGVTQHFHIKDKTAQMLIIYEEMIHKYANKKGYNAMN